MGLSNGEEISENVRFLELNCAISIVSEYLPKMYPCHLCKQQFTDAVERNDHLETHFTRQQCPSCNKVLILIDAELFVLSPHLPSQCLKDIAARKRDESTVPMAKRRKSILSEPNILVDGSIEGRIRMRKRKSERIKEKYFAQVDAVLEEDGMRKPERDENMRAGPKSRKAEWAKNRQKRRDPLATIEIPSSDDDKEMAIKTEACDTNQNSDGRIETARQLIESFRHDEQCLVIPGNLTYEIIMNLPETVNVPLVETVAIPSTIDENISIESAPMDTEVAQTLKDLITDNAGEIENVANEMFAAEENCGEELATVHILNVDESEIIKTENETNANAGQDVCNTLAQTKRGRPRKDASDSLKNDSEKTKKKRRRPALEKDRVKVCCEICGRCMFKSHLVRHIRHIHHGVQPNGVKPECDICGLVVSTQSNLTAHRLKHTKPRRFVCKVCNKGFDAAFHLLEHMNIHTGEKPHACEICGKKFARTTLKTSHMRIHTGEKPFKCKQVDCERAFSYNSDLKRHLYGAHGIWTKRHECDVCGKPYPEMKLLRKHMDKHWAAPQGEEDEWTGGASKNEEQIQ